MANIKSKASKKKVRRWGFSLLITGPQGKGFRNPLPNMAIGTSTDAKQFAQELLKELSPAYSGFQLHITPVGHETLSDYIVKTVAHNARYVEILTKAMEYLAQDWLGSNPIPSDKLADLQQVYLKKAVEFFHPTAAAPSDSIVLTDSAVPASTYTASPLNG